MSSKGSLRSSSPLRGSPHKAADGHAFRSAPGTPALCSTISKTHKWCKFRPFFTPFVQFDEFGVKSGAFSHQILDSADTSRDTIHITQAPGGGTQDANCEAPERTSPTSWRSHVTEYANILWQHRYVSTESEKCPVERPMTGQNTHFEQLIR